MLDIIRGYERSIVYTANSLYDEYYDEQDYYRTLYYEGELRHNSYYNDNILNMEYEYEKYEWIDTFLEYFRNDKHFLFCTEIVILLNNYEESGYENDLLTELKDLYKEYKKYRKLQIDNEVKEYYLNNNFKKTKEKLNAVNSELRRYHGFCNNQNVYDNILSILKIFRKLKHYYDKNIIIKDLKFNNKDSFKNEQVLLNYRDNLLKEFEIIRFIV